MPRAFRTDLPHHSRHATRFASRTGDTVLEKTARRRALITRAHIRPRSAPRFIFAGRCAAGAATVRRGLKCFVVASGPVNAEFQVLRARLVDAGAAHAGNATLIFHVRRYAAFQPAHRLVPLGRGIRKRPGATMRVAFATRGADGGVPRPDDEFAVIAAGPVKADIGARRPSDRERNGRANQSAKASRIRPSQPQPQG